MRLSNLIPYATDGTLASGTVLSGTLPAGAAHASPLEGAWAFSRMTAFADGTGYSGQMLRSLAVDLIRGVAVPQEVGIGVGFAWASAGSGAGGAPATLAEVDSVLMVLLQDGNGVEADVGVLAGPTSAPTYLADTSGVSEATIRRVWLAHTVSAVDVSAGTYALREFTATGHGANGSSLTGSIRPSSAAVTVGGGALVLAACAYRVGTLGAASDPILFDAQYHCTPLEAGA